MTAGYIPHWARLSNEEATQHLYRCLRNLLEVWYQTKDPDFYRMMQPIWTAIKEIDP